MRVHEVVDYTKPDWGNIYTWQKVYTNMKKMDALSKMACAVITVVWLLRKRMNRNKLLLQKGLIHFEYNEKRECWMLEYSIYV